MGIKTKFCPMGGGTGTDIDLGDLSLWRYSNEVISGKTLLYNYIPQEITTYTNYNAYYNASLSIPNRCFYALEGTDVPYQNGNYLYYNNGVNSRNYIRRWWSSSDISVYPMAANCTRNTRYDTSIASTTIMYPDLIYVPKCKGKSLINNWVNSASSGTTEANRNTPFYNDTVGIKSVNLQGVSFNNNSAYKAFYNCFNLVGVYDLPSSVTNMANTFEYCTNLNQNIQIPSSVTNMYGTFNHCTNLNQNIQIPNSVTDMYDTFFSCYNLNQNIQIPNSVTSMAHTFSGCTNLNQNIQIPSSVRGMYATFSGCYNLNQNIKIPEGVTGMDNTFSSCYNLNQNIQIPSSVTGMDSTFYNCYNLNQNIQIPNKVKYMRNTFFGTRLNQNIQIPSSVTYMGHTFCNCHSLNQNIQIPEGVIQMNGTFSGCYAMYYASSIPTTVTEMNGAFYNCEALRYIGSPSIVNIPYGVTNMASTFSFCYNLNQNIQIPSSVTNMYGTFNGCYNLSQVIEVPNGVTNVNYTFYRCNNLKAAYFHSAEITSFDAGINYLNNGNTHIVIPVRYIDNGLTTTYNTLKAAGWTVTNVGALVGPTGEKYHGWDIVQGDYPTYVANGTHYILQKWSGNLTANLTGYTPTDVVVPRLYNTYNLFPTAHTAACFYANTSIRNLYLNHSPISGTSAVNAYRGLTSVYGIWGANIPEGVTSAYALFYHADVAHSVSTGGYMSGRGYAVLPDSVTNCAGVFGYDKNLNDCYLYSRSGTTLAYSLDYCNTQSLNFVVEPANCTTLANIMRSANTSYRKNIYIHFKYSNGVATKTFNIFKPATYMGTSGNTSFANPSYNSTSNWYIYNLNPESIFTYSTNNISNYNNLSPIKCIAIMPKYPDYPMPSWVSTNTFKAKSNIKAIDMRNVIFNKAGVYTDMSSIFSGCRDLVSITNINTYYLKSSSINWFGAFSGCIYLSILEPDGFIDLGKCSNCADLFRGVFNLATMPFTNFNPTTNAIRINSSITNLSATFYGCTLFNSKLEGISSSVTDMHGTFYNCYNFNQNIKIPSSVIDMASTFYGCYDFNQNIQIPSTVTNMHATFHNCHSLNQYIQIPSSVTNIASTFSGCYSLNQNIQIPNNIIDMYATFYGCSSLNQNIQIPEGVTNMSQTFYGCSSINQNIQIPNSVIDMYSTFYNCHNLNQNIQIPEGVTDMYGTFFNCRSLNQNIKIPPSVTNMSQTFYLCLNLNQNIQIPESVTNMSGTFYYCPNLNQNIQIPESVTNMANTFYNCYNLNQNIKIPSSVTNMRQTFHSCYNLNQNIKIPEGVTDLALTFLSCSRLNQNIQIPSSVTNMSQTFSNCDNLIGDITVLSTELTNSYMTFYLTSNPKNVYIYYKYANGVYTKTCNLVVRGSSYSLWNGRNGVTVHDLGPAPW